MRVARLVLSFVLIVSSSPRLNCQQSVTAPQRDPQAIAVLQSSVATMGTLPADSVATGSIVTVAGSLTSTGTITILTRGTTQTSEAISTNNMQQTIVYSNGQAAEIQGGTLTRLSLQASLGSQTPDFPLPFLLSALNDPEISLQYVGLEALNDVAVHHVRVWNTFSSTPALQPLANFTLADLWVDPSSNLPLRISYGRRDAEGATPTLRVDLSFSGYSNVGGVLYPFKIQKALNGSPWGTVTIQKVVLNIGLMDSDFAVQ